MSKILSVGGGSGGHVTPVIAVLRELRKQDPTTELSFWCDRKFGPSAKKMIATFDDKIIFRMIFSGKFRRYHHFKWWDYLAHPAILFHNFFDLFLIFLGIIQSFFGLLKLRPDVVFAKGGFVCLPVGVAAKILRIPLVIHDSDAHPGLTNRILSRWATTIATGAPLEYYQYPKAISHYVGIPIGDEFLPYEDAQKQKIKQSLGLDLSLPFIVVTGGGLGAQRMNNLVFREAHEITKFCSVMLLSGTLQYDELLRKKPSVKNFILKDFVNQGMADILGAADVVVARAGATTLLELAALAKPTIIVPNGALTGGHQLKNAKVYGDSDAAVVMSEDDFLREDGFFVKTLQHMLKNPSHTQSMGLRFYNFSKPQAARNTANLIVSAIKNPDSKK